MVYRTKIACQKSEYQETFAVFLSVQALAIS